MASPELVHFVLRPNKNVERKLIIDCLVDRLGEFDLKAYRYVGMGSFWFADFLLVHKYLSVQDMVSIELPKYAERAEFNRPLRCIKVVGGETTKVLPETGLAEKPCIVWLDYDTDLNSGPVLQDIRIACSEMQPGGILLVTLNAHIGQLGRPKEQDDGKPWKLAALTRLAPDLVPLSLKEADLTQKKFQDVLATILFNHIKHCVTKADPQNGFAPIFNFAYKDNAQMVTVGGMIINNETDTRLKNCDIIGGCDFATGEKQFRIDVPPLTMKEKFAIDRLLPSQDGPTTQELKDEFGFSLKESQLRAYQRFYRFYPVFGEMQI